MEQKRTRVTAILVDGGYYRKRSRAIWGDKSSQERAEELYTYCMLHITRPEEPRDLYRIFYYDCPPMTRQLRHPLTGETMDVSQNPTARWMNVFFDTLVKSVKVRRMRKIALRMGELAESTAQYVLKDPVLRDLVSGRKAAYELTENDFRIDVKQKGVDMQIGLDVATLSQNRQVSQIVLITGDSDFLPVVKMARENGVEILLDPLDQDVSRSMIENVDGIESYIDADLRPSWDGRSMRAAEGYDGDTGQSGTGGSAFADPDTGGRCG